MKSMEYGTLEREIHVEASPEVAYEVVSSPEHIAQWWTDDASFESRPGAVGEFVFGDREDVLAMTVVSADPPRSFSFRWCFTDNKVDDSAKSMLVTFDLTPSATGTTIRLTETGFREMGWEEAKVAETYQDHVSGWDLFVPRLGEYVAKLVSAR